MKSVSEPLFIPGEIALSRITWECPCGCGTGISAGQEVLVVSIIPNSEKPPFPELHGVFCYKIDVGIWSLLGVAEDNLKKKPGNTPSVFDDKIWNPTKIKEKV